MNRIIVENKTKYIDAFAVQLVQNVMAMGRISDEGKAYCRATTFGRNGEIVVVSHRNKSSDKFVVMEGDS